MKSVKVIGFFSSKEDDPIYLNLLSNSGIISLRLFIPSTIPIEGSNYINNAKTLSSRLAREEKNDSISFSTSFSRLS